MEIAVTGDWQAGLVPAKGGRDTVLVGLLGSGIAASRTPHMHMTVGAELGLSYDYRLLDVDKAGSPPDLGALLDRLQAAGFAGINVTYPYKQAILPLLDTVSDDARLANAVNTVVFRDGRRVGENTDTGGFRDSFRSGLPDAPRRRVLLVGAGGAGGAVARALCDEGVERLLVHDVDASRAADLVARLGADRAEVVTDLAAAVAAADGIVNATPIGMDKLPGLPLPAEMIAPRHWVADIVYFPLETALLAAARARGCRVLPGSGMAVHQAVRAFELFTGLKPDPARMWAAFESAGASRTPNRHEEDPR